MPVASGYAINKNEVKLVLFEFLKNSRKSESLGQVVVPDHERCFSFFLFLKNKQVVFLCHDILSVSALYSNLNHFFVDILSTESVETTFYF